jgi:thioredoxin-dependent peroxiredoxin
LRTGKRQGQLRDKPIRRGLCSDQFMVGSMRLRAGDTVKPINLPGIDGATFHLESLKGKRLMLSFYRFASCPFCNLRIHELVKRHDELGKAFSLVAVFDAEIDDLKRHT